MNKVNLRVNRASQQKQKETERERDEKKGKGTGEAVEPRIPGQPRIYKRL
jgi:hypothetical protein